MIAFTVRDLLTGTVAVLLALSPLFRASACGPDLPEAEIFSTSHPDMPLKLFAAGKFGILPASYARSYLCVVYRYLSGEPLDRFEQQSIVELWHGRLDHQQWFAGALDRDPLDRYLRLRAKVVGYNEQQFANLYGHAERYGNEHNITLDAYSLASSTLSARISRFGAKSNEVSLWLKGQDAVFGLAAAGTAAIPQMVPGDSALLLQQDRQYQIAAATLYQGYYAEASLLFAAVAADPLSPWCTLAQYLVARCKFQEAMTSDSASLRDEAIEFISRALSSAKEPAQTKRLDDLLTPLLYKQLSPEQFLDHLVDGALRRHARRFGGDVGDLTFVMDEASLARDNDGQAGAELPVKLDFSRRDLTEWLLTIQQRSDFWIFDEKEREHARAQRLINSKHALAVWKERRTLPWLLAAMTGNGLRSDQELFSAAQQIPLSSPAYLTARYYVLDALIWQGQKSKALAELEQILSRCDLSPTTRNIFSAQLLAITPSIDRYLRLAMMSASDSMYEFAVLPQSWRRQENSNSYSTELVVFDDAVAEDLNRNLPLPFWLKLCHAPTVDGKLRGRILRSTWLRALLLERPELARQLAGPLALAYPQLSDYLRTWKNAAPGDSRRFAAARLILRNFGMTPYLDSGIERHGVAIGVFDDYNANFWLPLSVEEPKAKSDDQLRYRSVVSAGDNQLLAAVRANYKPGVRRFLSAADSKESLRERQVIWRNHPSRYLGESVFAWAESHPQDPDLPEMLYRIVRLPKWTDNTPVGSEYSHKAYLLLHAKYPKSAWARKATCWY